jgi:hypothetical protein
MIRLNAKFEMELMLTGKVIDLIQSIIVRPVTSNKYSHSLHTWGKE